METHQGDLTAQDNLPGLNKVDQSIHRQEVVLFWFRRDLRFDDNTGLIAAFSQSLPIVPVFVFDTGILNQLEQRADKRVDWIWQRLVAMNKELLHQGASLCVWHGDPLEAFGKWLGQFKVKAVYTNSDYEPVAIERDKRVEAFLVAQSVPFKSYKDSVVFEPNEVLTQEGKPYTVFTPFAKAWKRTYAAAGNTRSDQAVGSRSLNSFLRLPPQRFPTLNDLGFMPTDVQFVPPIIDENLIRTYHETRDLPALEGTTRLGIHLRFGTVSIRAVAAKAWSLNEVWLNELIWREFFVGMAVHFPRVFQGAFKTAYESIPWLNDEGQFDRWCKGQTGYPLVDAGMRELNATGWMHNRVRMVVASFLVKDLLIDWRWGEAYFASTLLDYEATSNVGNWQWVAGCGCDAAPYFRVFNPIEQAKRWDPEAVYISKWVPEWRSDTYLEPMVDHAFARERVLRVYRAALNA